MEKKNKKPILFLLLIAVVGIVVGGTLAYFTTTDTYTNIFNTGSYDIEMIEMCKIGVAMGNALGRLKEVADYVTDDIDNDGVYNALKHFEII